MSITGHTPHDERTEEVTSAYGPSPLRQFEPDDPSARRLRRAQRVAVPFVWLFALVARRSDGAFRTMAELFAIVPYALGIVLRGAFYRLTLPSFGDNVIVELGTVFVYRDVRVGSNVLLGRYCIVHHCDIGDFVLVGERCTFLSGSRQHGHARLDIPMALQGGEKRRITIGDDCWIGAHAVLLDDVAGGSIIGAGAVVTRAVPGCAVATGNPATSRPRARPEPAGASGTGNAAPLRPSVIALPAFVPSVVEAEPVKAPAGVARGAAAGGASGRAHRGAAGGGAGGPAAGRGDAEGSDLADDDSGEVVVAVLSGDIDVEWGASYLGLEVGELEELCRRFDAGGRLALADSEHEPPAGDRSPFLGARRRRTTPARPTGEGSEDDDAAGDGHPPSGDRNGRTRAVPSSDHLPAVVVSAAAPERLDERAPGGAAARLDHAPAPAAAFAAANGGQPTRATGWARRMGETGLEPLTLPVAPAQLLRITVLVGAALIALAVPLSRTSGGLHGSALASTSTALALAALVLIVLRAPTPASERPIHDRQLDLIIAVPLLAATVVVAWLLPFHETEYDRHRFDLLAAALLAAGGATLLLGTRSVGRLGKVVLLLVLVWPPIASTLERELHLVADNITTPILALLPGIAENPVDGPEAFAMQRPDGLHLIITGPRVSPLPVVVFVAVGGLLAALAVRGRWRRLGLVACGVLVGITAEIVRSAIVLTGAQRRGWNLITTGSGWFLAILAAAGGLVVVYLVAVRAGLRLWPEPPREPRPPPGSTPPIAGAVLACGVAIAVAALAIPERDDPPASPSPGTVFPRLAGDQGPP